MTSYKDLQPADMFAVPADDDGIVYTLDAEGSVSADGMETIAAGQVPTMFADAEIRVLGNVQGTNIVSIGFAPNGVEMFSWSEGDQRWEDYWMLIPGGGIVQSRQV